MPELRGKTVPIHARYDQAVEIHWRLADGRQLVERRTVPPPAVVETRLVAPAAVEE